MKQYIRMLFGIIIAVIFSCKEQEVESLFDKESSKRIQDQVEDLKTALLSSEHGWKILYFPDKDNVGGFNLLFKFIDETTVDMLGDISDADTLFSSSRYDIRLGSTVKLSFTTNNTIHKLSDSGNSPIPGEEGSGLKGDFEFLYYGKNDEGLLFRTNREQIPIQFVQATAEDTLSRVYDAIRKNLKEFISPSSPPSVFRVIRQTNAGDTSVSAITIAPTRRFLTFRGLENKEYGTIFYSTINSIILRGLRIEGGRTYNNDISLTYNDRDKSYSFTQSGSKFKIFYVNFPPTPLVGIDRLANNIDNGTFFRFWHFYDDGDLPQYLNDYGEKFEDIIDKHSTSSTAMGNLYVYFNCSFSFSCASGREPFVFRIFLSGSSRFIQFEHEFVTITTPEGVRHKIIVFKNPIWRGGTPSNADARGRVLLEIADILFNSEGFLVENLGRATRFSNNIFVLTSIANSFIRIPFYEAI